MSKDKIKLFVLLVPVILYLLISFKAAYNFKPVEIETGIELGRMNNRATEIELVKSFLERLVNDVEFRKRVNPILSDYIVSRFKRNDSQLSILQSGTPDYLSTWNAPILNNLCYAMHAGIPLVLDTIDPNDAKQMSGYYQKIKIYQQHVNDHNALLWLDLDTIIQTNDSRHFHGILDDFPRHQLIMADHSIWLNNGVFMFRRSEWTNQLLKRWWELSEANTDYTWNDNGSMYDLIVEALNEEAVKKGLKPCENRCGKDGVRQKSSDLANALKDGLECLGMPYNHRHDSFSDKIAILPQNVTKYRINQWYMHHRLFDFWVNDDYFRAGDIIAHAKEIDKFVSPNNLYDRCNKVNTFEWQKSFHRPTTIYVATAVNRWSTSCVDKFTMGVFGIA
jgi:hypothetical protein